jgi:hypothetical protein
MSEIIFVTVFGLFLAVILYGGFKVLPAERWQFVCSVPHRKSPEGFWDGINFTFYGALNGCSVVLATAVLFLLLASLSIPPWVIAMIGGALLAVCIPASKIVARIVEKKPSTLSVGGASFIGFLIAPWMISLVSTLFEDRASPLPILPVMAALSVSYAFGEGMGRLSCISFGCCYGKPLSQIHPLFRWLFGKWHFVFSGSTKKIAYAGHMEGQKVVPIQAMTSIVYCTVGLLGLLLFLNGHYAAAFSTTLVTTQIWRVSSEFFRADFRGRGTLSAYQWMGIGLVLYAFFILYFFDVSRYEEPALAAGLKSLWKPEIILFLQTLWMTVFVYTGKSQVTKATLSFHVVREKI